MVWARATPARNAALIAADGEPGKIRVLHLIGYLSESGGAERFAVGLATHLPADRFASLMCAPRGAEDGPCRELSAAGVPLFTLDRRSKWDVHRMAGLATLLRRHRVDILHSHLFGSNLWGSIIGRLAGVPVIIAHEHTWSYQGQPLRRFIDGRIIGRAVTRFIAVSSLDAQRMVELEHVPADKVQFIPTAYVPRAGQAIGDLRAEIGIRAGSPLIGTAAVLRPQKALDVLIDAHARLLERLPDAHLVIAGRGECRPALERQIAALHTEARVHLLGRRADIDTILNALDVAVMSSDFEGTPLFAFECMASRTPLVATAVGGLPDLIESGRTGVLVPPRDPEALADAVASLLQDEPRRRRLAAGAAETVKRYRIEMIAARFADLYTELAAAAMPAGRRPGP